MKKILIFIGTRPEAIKMAPVALSLQSDRILEAPIISTGQHGAMLSEAFEIFSLTPALDLHVLFENQSLASLGSKLLSAASETIKAHSPDLVLVHGDTSTAFFSALASFYASVPVAHVEAGLRTASVKEPFPEELNRRAISQMASFHFPPTPLAKNNLIREGVPETNIIVTGNTVIDSVKLIYEKFLSDEYWFKANASRIKENFFPEFLQRPFALVTLHRRENSGEGFKNYLSAVKRLSESYPKFNFVFPVHPNPNIKSLASEILGMHSNVYLVEPLGYLTFIQLLSTCSFVITDSGGIQEEAFAFNRPVLLCRESTERPEGIVQGHTIVIGRDFQLLETKARELLELELASQHPYSFAHLNTAQNPFGDGFASKKIRDFLFKAI
jgi:UDP-N-acetylglucosamine 2-epimerase (non-hydrolysing)